jgi:hypothetical protein
MTGCRRSPASSGHRTTPWNRALCNVLWRTHTSPTESMKLLVMSSLQPSSSQLPAEKPTLLPGRHEVDAGGTELRATRNGDLRCSDDLIEALDIIRIPGNVDYGIGNIGCEGPVRIEGDDVESDGNIFVAREVLNSTMVSGDTITVADNGRVVGGRLFAKNRIEIGVADQEKGVTPHLQLESIRCGSCTQPNSMRKSNDHAESRSGSKRLRKLQQRTGKTSSISCSFA